VRALIVEDELKMAALLRRGLVEEGYAADVARTGEDALRMARSTAYDAIVLDVMLPGLDGFGVCRELRSSGVWTPILMLTALDDVLDRVAGLDAGADDYLTKPFGVRELMARVRALLRRTTAREGDDVSATGPITYRHIEIDPARRRVRVGARDIELTSNEFQLLAVLLSKPGIVFSREALLSRVWNDETYVTVRSVDTLVKRLRKKVEADPADPEVILTVWGTGYKAADVS
jgi:DNA-binding response OmpR family regulator